MRRTTEKTAGCIGASPHTDHKPLQQRGAVEFLFAAWHHPRIPSRKTASLEAITTNVRFQSDRRRGRCLSGASTSPTEGPASYKSDPLGHLAEGRANDSTAGKKDPSPSTALLRELREETEKCISRHINHWYHQI